MPSDSEQAAELTLLFTDLNASNASCIGALTLFVFDYFLTISQEISYTWHKKRSTGTVLFLLLYVYIRNVYCEIMANQALDSCRGYFRAHIATSLISILLGKGWYSITRWDAPNKIIKLYYSTSLV
ncbi:hypothetical protein M422DRAFT_42244 [Sphaerobolus stellatus SS14]|nr:hypothetical protein M422DRAFT_42244 [Sphaerobolus stellatus SS14]